MVKYYKYNINPKGYKTGDCSTRALASTLGISWEQALKEQYEGALATYKGITCKEVSDYVLSKYGYIKMKQPRKDNGKKYLIREIDELVSAKEMEEGIFVSLASHDTCIKNGNIIDIWDCGYKTIGNYWVKKGQ